ncbi:MAG: hypothetical protein AB8G11_26610 [Saprospiraceae bacterium]
MNTKTYHEIEERFTPETHQEQQIIKHPEWREGAMWGKPRYGHPEGKVLYHIEEVLLNVEAVQSTPKVRQDLRFITLTHDTFKHKEHRGFPRDWSKHHAVLARQFSEQFTDNQGLLDIIEFHDEAYYVWKMEHKLFRKNAAQRRLDKLLLRLGDNLQLFYLFFKCDTQTGDKNQKSVEWFEATVKDIDIVFF